MVTTNASFPVGQPKIVVVFAEEQWPLLTDMWEATHLATSGFKHPIDCEVDFISQGLKLPYEEGRWLKYIRSGEFYRVKPDPERLRFCLLTKGTDNQAVREISRNLWDRWNAKGKRPGQWDISKLLSARLATAINDVYPEGDIVVREVKKAVLFVFMDHLFCFEQFMEAHFLKMSVPKEFIEQVEKILNLEFENWPNTVGRRAIFEVLGSWKKKVETFEIPTLWYSLYLRGCNLEDQNDTVRGIIVRDAKALARQKTYQASGDDTFQQMEKSGVVSTHEAQNQKVVVVRNKRPLVNASVSRHDTAVVIDLQSRGFENMFVGIHAGLHSGVNLLTCLSTLQAEVPDGRWEGDNGNTVLFFSTRKPINRGVLDRVLTVIIQSLTFQDATQSQQQRSASTQWIEKLEDAKWVSPPSKTVWTAASASQTETIAEEDPIAKMVKSLLERQGDIDVMSLPTPQRKRASSEKRPNFQHGTN